MRRFREMCRHDYVQGIWKQKEYFILPVFLVLITCIVLHNRAGWYLHTAQYGKGTFMDYWIYLIQGRKPYKPDIYTLYLVPVTWVTFYTFLIIIVNSYPAHDLEQWGIQVVIRSKSRLQWWLSKCIWCILCVCLYFFVSFVTIAAYAGLNGIGFSLHPTDFMMDNFGFSSFLHCSWIRLILITVVQPMALAMFIGILQMVISLRFDPVISFVTVFVLLMASAYKRSWFLPGNWGMPCRISRISKGGLDCNMVLLALGIGIIVCILAGYRVFKRQDIIKKEGII